GGALMVLVGRLKSPPVIEYLWQQVKRPRALSVEAKLTALTILQEMGEDVDLKDPSRYFSVRELKPADVKSAEKLFSMGWRAAARTLRELHDAADVEAYMHEVFRMSETAIDGVNFFPDMVKDAESSA